MWPRISSPWWRNWARLREFLVFFKNITSHWQLTPLVGTALLSQLVVYWRNSFVSMFVRMLSPNRLVLFGSYCQLCFRSSLIYCPWSRVLSQHCGCPLQTPSWMCRACFDVFHASCLWYFGWKQANRWWPFFSVPGARRGERGGGRRFVWSRAGRWRGNLIPSGRAYVSTSPTSGSCFGTSSSTLRSGRTSRWVTERVRSSAGYTMLSCAFVSLVSTTN